MEDDHIASKCSLKLAPTCFWLKKIRTRLQEGTQAAVGVIAALLGCLAGVEGQARQQTVTPR
jgi:hypothetical protein